VVCYIWQNIYEAPAAHEHFVRLMKHQLLILLVDLSVKCAFGFLLHVVQAYSAVCLTRLTTASNMRSNLNDLELRYGIKCAAVLTAALLRCLRWCDLQMPGWHTYVCVVSSYS
jgi:hypothetical protein